MKQIKTKNFEILVVEIPDCITWCKILENNFGDSFTKALNLSKYFLIYGTETGTYYDVNNFYLPEGKWIIIGKLLELTDKDCEVFVKMGSYTNTYWNYITNNNHKSNQLKSAKESFKSLLQSEGIDTSKEQLILQLL